MRERLLCLLPVVMVVVALVGASPAQAEFGLENFDVTFTDASGASISQAGSHPFAMTTSFEVKTTIDETLGEIPAEAIKDLDIEQIEGLAGNPTAVPRCTTLDFLARAGSACPDSSALGITDLEIPTPGSHVSVAVYNLEPPPGVAAKLGFWAISVPVTVEVGLTESAPYRIVARSTNIAQPVPFYGAELTVWGNPAEPAHDEERGQCAGSSGAACPADIAASPFLTLPRACGGPLETAWEADSWVNPGTWIRGSALTHDDANPPNPLGFTGCERLGFSPRIAAQPTTASAESPTGLDFSLSIDDEGLNDPTGIAQSDVERAVVTLPEGMTANPSLAEGLAVCTSEQYESERLNTAAGAGCPNGSKIGTIEVQTPLLEGQTLRGALHVAEPFKNPFGSLIALYMVFRSPELGIVVKQAARVIPDPRTGQLRTVVDDIPQLPFSSFRLRFREGARSPLVSPPSCGSHTVVGEFTPYADPSRTLTTGSSFEISSGPGGGACPEGGVPPFRPGLEAGTLNNSAGTHSPFHMRLTRRDGDQDMTRFAAILPPGLLARLVGVSRCPEARIAAARAKTAGRDEISAPSCPSGSLIGHTEAGAGVGSVLTYVPGKLYLAGPYRGAPLSVVAITPAVAGPFDAGTVVVRVALDLNRKTGEVEVDGSASDPIPHVLQGIVLKLRDLRVNVDRPRFTLNPTSCRELSLRATVFGSFIEVFDPADDVPVALSERFQAADCASLAFKPRLALGLRGGTRRGGHPALRAVMRPRAGDANLSRAVVRLPRSAFLDQAHIRTVCTRVQFAAESCPPGSVYGRVRAFTPLLDQPLEGAAYLRSSSNDLPDLVFDLKGIVDIEASARIDSVRGGIRATFAGIPDAPLEKVVVNMAGGKRGLIVNSTDLCGARRRADVRLDAQNGRRKSMRPLVRAKGCKKR